MWPELNPAYLAWLGGLLGLLVGSFLNVVIHRLPLIMQAQWTRECAELTGQSSALLTPGTSGLPELTHVPAALSLSLPRSACPHCSHTIAWHENIPVLSYLRLRGKCSACGQAYGLRYPLVELFTDVLFYGCVLRWGASYTSLAWCGFSAAILTLALIDWDSTLLPDEITLPLLWAGLIAAALQINPGVSLVHAFWGAVGGYMSLWLVYQAFKLITGKEGMGYGDFKLFAAMGAWLGWTALLPMILLASMAGAVVGLVLKYRARLRDGAYLPFGPFLAASALLMMVWGPVDVLLYLGLAL
jgi:leader peptidase (prepilin peptidase)/N-methyltransferase